MATIASGVSRATQPLVPEPALPEPLPDPTEPGQPPSPIPEPWRPPGSPVRRIDLPPDTPTPGVPIEVPDSRGWGRWG